MCKKDEPAPLVGSRVGAICAPSPPLTSGSARRYPFYMLGSCNTEWKTLTWLRYTIWIPLYPLGVIAEGELRRFKRGKN